MKGYRVGVVGPLSPFGRRVRQAVDERAFPVIELKLFDTESGASSTLTQFDDEVLITQPLDPDLFPTLDLMFVGEGTGEDVLSQAASAARQGVLTFVAGATKLDAPIAARGLNDKLLPEDARLVVAPRAASILLGKVLDSLAGSFEIEQARATLMLPAAELGEQAVQELHQQVVQILNFGSPPTEFLGEQLAFNLALPREDSGEESPGQVVAKEASELAGLEADTVSVSLVRAPVFHSYALSLWVQLAKEPTLEAVDGAVRGQEDVDFTAAFQPSTAVATPVSVAGSEKIHVGKLWPDGGRRGTFWLWVVADSTAVDAASNALELAEKLLGASGHAEK